jgi:alkanesulfonate monooxygenase SsuD/methylene tetrahydromethanopterin reductase-like flavin-dependent oxidoreductase (luciferase family)
MVDYLLHQSTLPANGSAAGFSPARVAEIEMAVGEALTNMCTYAYPEGKGEVQVQCTHDAGPRLYIDIVDGGVPFDPLSVAEEGALVDALSGGRLRLGVSAGYSPVDLQAFDVPANERGRRMREGLQLIRAVWTGEHGALGDRFSHLSGFTLFPKPVQQPAPPIYVGATVDTAIRRAARLGDEFIISTTQRIGDIPRMLSVYHEELRKSGRDPGVKVTVLNRIVHVVPDRAAKQEAIHFFGERFLRLYDAWGHQNVTELDHAARSLAQVSQEHFIIGEMAECVELIAQYAALGIGEIACLMNFGGPDRETVERSMRFFAERVMPRFATG